MKLPAFLLLAILYTTASAQNTSTKEVDAVFPDAHSLYLDLHQHPELSSHEVETAAKIASHLRALGYQVTEHVGGTGVVAIMKNGPGPTIMLRTELDALPVEEKTGLPYASKVHTKDDSGNDVGVMHACGHDLHMATLVGTAAVMAHSKDTWHGTLMLIGQPAEETISGAKAMLADGLFTRFPKPDIGVALHDGNLPVGTVGYTPGVSSTNADSIRITIYGKGAHGSAPQVSIDPILIAARTIVTLQSIVSREVRPGDAAVITVGYIHAGTKNNIIPDQATMGITVRTYKPEVRAHVLAAINRVVKAEAEAAGAERMPLVEHYEGTSALYNDPKLTQHLSGTLAAALGKDNVTENPPGTASEDYSYYIDAGVPSFFFSLGASDPQKIAESKASGKPLPGPHSPLFAPVAEPALRTGITAEVAVLRELLKGTSADARNLVGPQPIISLAK